jgi:hypothetical protein
VAEGEHAIRDDRKRNLRLAAFGLVQLGFEAALDAASIAVAEAHQLGLRGFGKRL